ncbi:MAG: hypothetical protein ABIQ91_01460 [Candidatus Paceibacterota bacterium]
MIFGFLKKKGTRLTAEQLMADRKLFDKTIYTSLEQARKELKARSKDEVLERTVRAMIPGLPEPFAEGTRAVIFRQLVTPNYEIRRFFSIVDAVDDIQPLFWEYYDDKFTSNNEWKHSLGKLAFYKGKGKKGGSKIDTVNIIDFNVSNGKKISEVKTLWGQSLVDFHHEFFDTRFRPGTGLYFDATKWFSQNGGTAKSYYKHFLALFVRDGILFENFMLDEKEYSFTKEVFLPAFLQVWHETGQKPLIVSLEPTDIEGDQFWICHPDEDRDFIVNKMGLGAGS